MEEAEREGGRMGRTGDTKVDENLYFQGDSEGSTDLLALKPNH